MSRHRWPSFVKGEAIDEPQHESTRAAIWPGYAGSNHARLESVGLVVHRQPDPQGFTSLKTALVCADVLREDLPS